MNRKILTVALITLTLLCACVSACAADLPKGYEALDSLRFEADYWENLDIPYRIPSQTTAYRWELTFSDLSRPEGRCGSLVGEYDHSSKRTGYIYSNASWGTADAPVFGSAIGNSAYGNAAFGASVAKDTLTAEYDASNPSNKTFYLHDTLGLVNSSGTWSGSYATDRNFTLTACAVYNYGVDNPIAFEFVSVTFYGLKIYEGSTLKVDMVPAQRLSDGKLGAYDLVSDTFFPKITHAEDYAPAAPKGLTVKPASAPGVSDGVISGVDETMEYSVDGGAWKLVTGSEITGLPAGKVRVRVKASGVVPAGLITTVTVKALPVPPIPATGDGTPLLLSAALLLLSAAGFLVLRRARRS